MIELMFALALDMSLPEFQPQEDLSGNYIVGTYDVSNDEVIVEEIPVDAFDGLSVEAQQGEMLRAIETKYVYPSSESGYRVSSGAIGVHSSSTLWYIYLTEGIEYTVNNPNNYSLFTCTWIGKGATCTTFTDSSITPSSNIYLVSQGSSSSDFNVTYLFGDPDDNPDIPDTSGNDPEDPSGNDPEDPSGNDPEDPSGNDPSGNDPSDDNISGDLTNVENKLNNIITLQRSILLVLLVSFLFPIIISCVKLLKGGKDV